MVEDDRLRSLPVSVPVSSQQEGGLIPSEGDAADTLVNKWQLGHLEVRRESVRSGDLVPLAADGN